MSDCFWSITWKYKSEAYRCTRCATAVQPHVSITSLELLVTSSHSALLIQDSSQPDARCFVIFWVRVLCSSCLGTPAHCWFWGASHPRVQRLRGFDHLLVAAQWLNGSQPYCACCLLLTSALHDPCLEVVFFFSFFWPPMSAWKIYTALKEMFHSSASYYSCCMSNKIRKGGREKKKDGSWCFIWKASGQKWLCFRHVDRGEAAFAAQWKVCASEKRPPSSVTRSAGEECQYLFFKICLHLKKVMEKQWAMEWLVGSMTSLGKTALFHSVCCCYPSHSCS